MTILTIITSILILLAGTAKLFQAKPLVDQFKEFGISKSVMLLVGTLEVSAATGLHVVPLRLFASIGMMILMIGALGSHFKVGHSLDKSVPATAVLLLSAIIAFNSWSNSLV